MKASKVLIDKIKEFEGFRAKAYLCPSKVWTIGYGHTKGVRSGMVVTEEQAEKLLVEDLKTSENYVNGLRLDLTQGQFDALVDFAFNCGIGNLQSSTLLKKVSNQAPTAEIQAEFNRWIYSKGKPLQGLILRRKWEAKRFEEVM